jgi:tRNA threonylcarbamoyladenosine biosynthesis protein TsaE
MSGARRLDPAHRAEPEDELPVLGAELVVPTAAAMREIGARLAGVLQAGDLVILSGELGAGKTTLARGIGAGLSVRGEVTSPTFVIARVHPSLVGGPALVHVDAYRLESLIEVDDLDLDASLGQSVTVVEWGEGLVEGLASDRLQVRLDRPHGAYSPDGPAPEGPEHELDEPRTITFRGYGSRWAGVDLLPGA